MSKFLIYKSEDSGEQCWRWKLFNNDEEWVAESEESFIKKNITPSIKRFRAEACNAPIWEDESSNDQDTGYRFEYQRRSENRVRWRFRAGNNKTMAMGFIFGKEAIQILKQIQSITGQTEIEWDTPEDDPAFQEKCDDRTETKGIPGS